MVKQCRHCSERLEYQILDLGHQPPSNNYLSQKQLDEKEITYPLVLFLCEKCGLVQLPETLKPKELFTADYAYFSSTSESWCQHAKDFVEQATKELSLNKNSYVVEIASNDGYLLQYIHKKGIPCLGIEPTTATAKESKNKGIDTIEEFFGSDLASNLKKADLVIANNVIAHVPDINDFVKGISILLKKDGFASIEFPHLFNLLKYNQFDTIYHEHYSYLSLETFRKIALKSNLDIVNVEQLNTHGGSLRVWLTHKNKISASKNVTDILQLEKEKKITEPNGFKSFIDNVEKIKHSLIKYLIQEKEKNNLVAGYGAAAKGNTLLNYSGVKKDLLEFIVDRAKSKQGMFMPGSHIPIYDIKALNKYKPDTLLVLPWNLINEIGKQQKNYRLITSIPILKVYE